MDKITVSPSKDYFVRGGSPFFYLADTAWSVFSNAKREEWLEYLDYRAMQGFNALQISVLPVLHDASATYVGLEPFETAKERGWNFSRPRADFFNNAAAMVDDAVQRGFVPVLVLLWANYVPDTTFSRRDASHVMPLEYVAPYVELAAETFSPFRPIFVISGDTNFPSDATVEHYQVALETVKRVAPDCLTSFHLQPGVALPSVFVDSDKLDFYMYQAGHRIERNDLNYVLAEEILKYPVRRPIVNAEPSYEGHGHGDRYGRFGAFHLRKAFWQSVLSGAKAGFTYGAHGVWSWHRRGASFTSEAWSKIPFDRRTAMRLPGAWDVAFARWLFERYTMHELNARNDLVLSEYREIRLAARDDLELIVAYLPYPVDLRLRVNLGEYEVNAVELEHRNLLVPQVSAGEGASTIAMIEINSDYVVIASRRGRPPHRA